MALIKCKECGHMISEKALVCPKCGYPVEKGNDLLEEKGNTNKNSSTPSKSVGRKWRLSDILWIVILFGIAFAMIYYATISSKSSDSSTTEASYGPGTYEFVDEAGQQWQLFIGIEEVGDASNYTLEEVNRVIFTKLSTGQEYKGEWEGFPGVHWMEVWEGVHHIEIFGIHPDPDIVFQRMPRVDGWDCYILNDGYLYIRYSFSWDKDNNEFNFPEALKQKAPEIRLPLKKIK